ncbi:hypothetical protein [Acidipila rosea]|uniref:Magnetosome protein MamS/MamX domain-containing protein n=1 Tax=Acidipila rosea TaxID=768535 RepID=A0A4R1L750_9BACT|nr:hypothetical protein [Acidipila rosea]MBW4043685.1 hypothetical protein [Acidobacteriota bacterium]TCK73984.1 hypothetical protein C7378_1604 [Acidipila rosea]
MIKHKRYFYALSILLAMVILAPAMYVGAQTTDTPTRRSLMYNTATETTVSGTIEAVNQVTGRRGWNGTHLQLKTAEGVMDVHVGPSWFLTQKKFELAKGDQVEITGSKVKFNDADALIARTIKKGESELTLRNAQGIPAWSRGGRN